MLSDYQICPSRFCERYFKKFYLVPIDVKLSNLSKLNVIISLILVLKYISFALQMSTNVTQYQIYVEMVNASILSVHSDVFAIKDIEPIALDYIAWVC